MSENWQAAILPPTASLASAIENLNKTGIKIVLCTDAGMKLVGTVTDGDVRRGLSRGLRSETSLIEVMNQNPLVLPASASKKIAMEIMEANKVLQVPVVDDRFRVVGLHLWDTLDTVSCHDHSMVIMAGGEGNRLRPLTEECPKPMLPVAGKPMLQHIIERAKAQGFQSFILSLNYLGHVIRDYFGTGAEFGVQMSYIEETEPLGTAGALSLLSPRPESCFVVTNGDVLTDIDYRQLVEFHDSQDADGVMAVRQYEWVNPYGVVEMRGVEITGFNEKPVILSHINAGVYALSPSALNHLVPHKSCDMPTLFDRIRTAGMRTVAYPMHEPLLDVGRHSDYEQAQVDFKEKVGE